MTRIAMVAVIGFIVLGVSPVWAQATNEILQISPDTAAQGTAGLTVTFTLDTDVPPAPPAGVIPASVTIGTISGTGVTHASQYTVTAVFDIPAGETPGAKDAAITFSPPSGGTLTFSLAGGFTVTPATGPPVIVVDPSPVTVCEGGSAGFTVTASGAAPLAYQWQKDGSDIPAADGASYTISPVAPADAGDYRCVVTNGLGDATSDSATLTVIPAPCEGLFPVVDTGQTTCYGDSTEMACPSPGEAFYGQDAQHAGHQPGYTLSADELTVYDGVTGLTWQKLPDTNGDGTLDSTDKLTWSAALTYAATLNSRTFGGYSDWRLPSIKELYSLMDFRGLDPSGVSGNDTSWLTPFIDRTYFDFVYGDTAAGERIIDAQYWSSTPYVGTTMGGNATAFGVNFADGRIKGYPTEAGPLGSPIPRFVRYVRGNALYGVNDFADNGDGTVTDRATGLMWTKAGSGSGMDWRDALAWVEARNAESYLGYNDWRLPDAKELQSIVDYTRSPDTTGSAAIDPVFDAAAITNEAGEIDYPFYWSGTTHVGTSAPDVYSGAWGAYVCFGRAMGYMNGSWLDVHGAGAQRSDPKDGDPGDYPAGHGPQGDAVRILNFVRLVRDAAAGPVSHAVLRLALTDPTERLMYLPLDPVRDFLLSVEAGPLSIAGDVSPSTGVLTLYAVPDAALLTATRLGDDIVLHFSF
jgi:hypothetical protein